MSFGFKVLITGDYACFTRPEMKVERVSYDVPTPSALEGLLKSIYWKPAIRYEIDKIVVFKPIKFANIRRNEVKEKISYSNISKKMKARNDDNSIDISIYASECRSQRSAMVLRDVCYGVEFHFEMTGLKSDNPDDSEKKHYNIIKRRLENGQFFRSPCLGNCEFPVREIKMVDDFDLSQISESFIDRDIDLGFMLYGLNYEDKGMPVNGNWDNPKFSDKADAVYYRPHLVNGIIEISKYREGLKC